MCFLRNVQTGCAVHTVVAPGVYFLGAMRPERKAVHSPLSGADIKTARTRNSTPACAFTALHLHGKQEDFTFTHEVCLRQWKRFEVLAV